MTAPAPSYFAIANKKHEVSNWNGQDRDAGTCLSQGVPLLIEGILFLKKTRTKIKGH